MSTCCICSSNSSLSTLSITINSSTRSLSFSIVANFSLPVSLWASKPLPFSPSSKTLLDETATNDLLLNIFQDVLKYGPTKTNTNHYFPKMNSSNHNLMIKSIFNVSFLTLVFLVCMYEAPIDLRSNCLYTVTDHLTCQQSREGTKVLMRLMGSTVEEQWLRCINLAITNWKMELKSTAKQGLIRAPSALFCHGVSTYGMWKVQLYCPVITMEVESLNGSPDERLSFSLNYHQLEGVIQLNYKVIIQENWVDVLVNIDNIRLDVVQLVKESLLKDRGAGATEKHFPSRMSLQLTPTTLQTSILSVSVSKSSDNPTTNKHVEKSIEGSLEPPYKVGLTMGATQTTSTVIKPWKFEEFAVGDSGSLNWFLHDKSDGREVFSSRPSPMARFQPNAWFKHRYSNVNRPFTRQGGVVFARDSYGETVCWKVDKSAIGKRMEWEISGCIGLTYWPNKYRTGYNETRRAEFRETLHLTLA